MYQLHNILREYFPDTYIQYFGGHSHIRDFTIVDELSTGLQSGRYCETVGFLSLTNFTDAKFHDDFIHTGIDRKYIDFNIHSFMHHTNKSSIHDFNTERGLKASKELYNISKDSKLSESYGFVPNNFYMAAADYRQGDSRSLMRFLENSILPQLKPKLCDLDGNQDLFQPNESNARAIIINTGSVRYDLYKGDFTKNTLFTVSPFKNKWRVVPNVPSEIASQIQPILNNAGYIIKNEDQETNMPELLSPYQRALNHKLESIEQHGFESSSQKPFNVLETISDSLLSAAGKLSYGYTTSDELGDDGDDTIHKQLKLYQVPNVIQSYEEPALGANAFDSADLTDLVYYDFIESHIFWALKIACGKNQELFNTLTKNAVFYNNCAEEYNVGHLLKQYVVDHWS
ncbi:unnamed protein product [Ambrosiozyma monospora]|uniref:Unnamed protein product n=1 Tax=Ambrosiozyma monospora TaxID=43982 RepID=A0A9W6YYL1_AMBMO|nr:unnamed protein product [Ambrosiozyma monospora]